MLSWSPLLDKCGTAAPRCEMSRPEPRERSTVGPSISAREVLRPARSRGGLLGGWGMVGALCSPRAAKERGWPVGNPDHQSLSRVPPG